MYILDLLNNFHPTKRGVYKIKIVQGYTLPTAYVNVRASIR